MGVRITPFGYFVGDDDDSNAAALEGNRAVYSICRRLDLDQGTHPAALLVLLDAELQAREDSDREQQDALAGRELETVCAFMDVFQEAFGTTHPLDAMSHALHTAGFLSSPVESPTGLQVANVVHDILVDLVESR